MILRPAPPRTAVDQRFATYIASRQNEPRSSASCHIYRFAVSPCWRSRSNCGGGGAKENTLSGICFTNDDGEDDEGIVSPLNPPQRSRHPCEWKLFSSPLSRLCLALWAWSSAARHAAMGNGWVSIALDGQRRWMALDELATIHAGLKWRKKIFDWRAPASLVSLRGDRKERTSKAIPI